MAIIKRKRKSGKMAYQVKVRDQYGRWFPLKTFDTKKEAESHERHLKDTSSNGSLAVTAKQGAMLFSEYWEVWKKECRANVSGGWKYSQDQMYRDYLKPTIGGLRLNEIRSSDVGGALNAMEKMGRGPATRVHVYNMTRKMMSDAIEYFEILHRNPVVKKLRPKVLEKSIKPLDVEDSITLLNYSRDKPLGPAIWLGMLAAMRPNEIQALRVGAIDFKRKLIRIEAGYKRKIKKIEPYPKQKKLGIVPIIPPLEHYLREVVAGKSKTDFVVNGTKLEMLQHKNYSEVLKRRCAEAGVAPQTPHLLRHCSTELWVEWGASEEDLVRLLNHAGSGSIRRYIHRNMRRLHKIGKKIDISPNLYAVK